jgi:hypothetical protein
MKLQDDQRLVVARVGDDGLGVAFVVRSEAGHIVERLSRLEGVGS